MSELNYSGWVRQQMLQTQNLTIEQLQEAHDKSDWDKSLRPDEKILNIQKPIICKRWGIKTFAEIPYKSDGSLNISAMVRFFLKKNPKADYASCLKHFSVDGLFLSDALFAVTRNAMRKKQSPDDNQHNGPRAGKPKEKVKKEKKKAVLSENTYLQMLVDSKKLVDKLGGIGPTRKMLDILELIGKQSVT